MKLPIPYTLCKKACICDKKWPTFTVYEKRPAFKMTQYDKKLY